MALPLLIINPNTTESMTHGLEELLKPYNIVPRPIYFTAPNTEGGIPSINNSDDCHASAKHVLPHLLPDPDDPSDLLNNCSGVLIACYSVHPLVRVVKRLTDKPVVGIFEASVTASLHLLGPNERFGIVSTGKIWETILSDGVGRILGPDSERFAGVETTGLSAVELHTTPAEQVRQAIKDAVKRLLRRGRVGAICLGCAGMAGMQETVEEACVEELGPERGCQVKIIDGVKYGVAMLEGLVKFR